MFRKSPSDSPYWNVWTTVLWGLLVAAAFVLIQGVILYSRLGPGTSEEAARAAAENGTEVSIATIGAAIACCLLIVLIIRLKKGAAPKDYLALDPAPQAVLFKWLAYLAIAIVLSDGLTTALGKPLVPDVMVRVYQTSEPVWLIWFALILAGPVFEEVFFRGFLYRGLRHSYLGTIGAVVVTAAVWALVHAQYDAYGIATVFGLGLLLGAARARTDSLIVPLVMHAATNLVATIEAALIAQG